VPPSLSLGTILSSSSSLPDPPPASCTPPGSHATRESRHQGVTATRGVTPPGESRHRGERTPPGSSRHQGSQATREKSRHRGELTPPGESRHLRGVTPPGSHSATRGVTPPGELTPPGESRHQGSHATREVKPPGELTPPGESRHQGSARHQGSTSHEGRHATRGAAKGLANSAGALGASSPAACRDGQQRQDLRREACAHLEGVPAGGCFQLGSLGAPMRYGWQQALR